jgi:hypothetical protein
MEKETGSFIQVYANLLSGIVIFTDDLRKQHERLIEQEKTTLASNIAPILWRLEEIVAQHKQYVFNSKEIKEYIKNLTDEIESLSNSIKKLNDNEKVE